MKELLIVENQEQQVVEEVILVTSANDDDMSEDKKEIKRIENKLTLWISKKGFTRRGVTIEELAIELSTNRTYLSSFINSTYNLSFREWIALHRIEYAKELLLADEDVTSSKIAEIVGYSPNAFTTIFSKVEKMSPMQWRNINKL